jgi:hypothetical protein
MLHATRAAAAASVQALLVMLGALATALEATSAAANKEPASTGAHASSRRNSCKSDDTAYEGSAADALHCKQSAAEITAQQIPSTEACFSWQQQQQQEPLNQSYSTDEAAVRGDPAVCNTLAPTAGPLTYVVTPGSSTQAEGPCDVPSARCSFDARSRRVNFDASSARASLGTRSSGFDFLRRKSVEARSSGCSIDCSSAAANALVGPGWSHVLSFTNSSSGSEDGCAGDAAQHQQEAEGVKLGEQQLLLLLLLLLLLGVRNLGC